MNPDGQHFRLRYQPSLDGIRGMAILLVLLNHGRVLGNGFGFIGVNTFFALSGFLITCLLIEEFDETGEISLRKFYLRRALRLMPALLAMLVAFIIFAFMVDPHKRAVRELNEALCALFYFTNWGGIYQIGRHASLAHTWSLSVEEQFYFIWPLILMWLLKRTSRSSLACWIFLGAFLSVITRISLLMLSTQNLSGNILPVNPHRLLAGTDARADSLLLGCFAAVLITSNFLPKNRWFTTILKMSAVPSLVGLLVLGTCGEESSAMVCAGWFTASVLAMLLIMQAILKCNWPRWLFENRFVVGIGKISYGLYIWHFPILLALQQQQLPWQNLVYLVPVIPVVLLSYFLIEKPCLRLKERFQMVT